MASRSDKLYGDSPEMERDDKGKMAMKRRSQSKPKPKHDMGEMGGRHQREMAEMHKRHLDEHKALAERQEKEAQAQQEAQQPPMAGGDAGAGAAQPPMQQG